MCDLYNYFVILVDETSVWEISTLHAANSVTAYRSEWECLVDPQRIQQAPQQLKLMMFLDTTKFTICIVFRRVSFLTSRRCHRQNRPFHHAHYFVIRIWSETFTLRQNWYLTNRYRSRSCAHLECRLSQGRGKCCKVDEANCRKFGDVITQWAQRAKLMAGSWKLHI